MNIVAYDCIIEIAKDSYPIKYEFDKDLNQIRVDRVMNVAMNYPANYGFIPKTLSKDGDPLDILLISQFPIIPGAVIKVRSVGVLIMEDEAGQDEKIICVPDYKIDPYFAYVNDIEDLNSTLLQRISHFFESYKHLEKGKWVKIEGFKNKQIAEKLIQEAFDNYKNSISSIK